MVRIDAYVFLVVFTSFDTQNPTIFNKVETVKYVETLQQESDKNHFYSKIGHNQDNFRDAYSDKPKGVTRQEWLAAHPNIDRRDGYFEQMMNRAKRVLKNHIAEERDRLSELTQFVPEYEDYADATQMHHIFPKHEFPEIMHHVENLIALTPNQHFGLAHPMNNTQIIDPRFICVNRPVIIKKNERVVTDIDATVVDKETGTIALFQLKWQDPTTTSIASLKSKKANFANETSSWIDKVTTWINESSAIEIASLLGIKAKYLKTENMRLFVLGRKHSCYSGNIPPTHEVCAWCQWYQLLQTIKNLSDQQLLSLESLHNTLKQTTPFSKRIIEHVSKFIYGKYRIYFGGKQHSYLRNDNPYKGNYAEVAVNRIGKWEYSGMYLRPQKILCNRQSMTV